MNNDFIDLLSGIANTPRDPWTPITTYFEKMGFPIVVWAGINTESQAPTGLMANFHDEWIEHYFSQEYMDADPWFGKLVKAERTINYSFDRRHEVFPEAGEQTFKMLGELWDMGLCTSHFPDTSKENGIASGFNLWSNIQEQELLTSIGERHGEFKVACALANNAILNAPLQGIDEMYGVTTYPIRGLGATLSTRELEALKHLSEGCRNDRIAEKMGISLPTVRFHFQNIRLKLKAQTREQALAIALTNGILKI
ncbi:response regulator transcription factor [Pseudahrensia aquimaris]|uniref:Response regulator transcription factor n=1 Tax=Pseudahrensia aquimaris TaxID=744461 RepID=A0ABW3FDN0_9HYPH